MSNLFPQKLLSDWTSKRPTMTMLSSAVYKEKKLAKFIPGVNYMAGSVINMPFFSKYSMLASSGLSWFEC